MPSYTLQGNQLIALLEDVQATLEEDKKGVQTATLVYTGIWPGCVALAQAIASHPDFSHLKRESFTVSRIPPAMATVTVRFIGIVGSASAEYPGQNKTYSMKVTTGAEPIETHPDADTIVGYASSGSPNPYGATFDKDGKFEGFAVDTNPRSYYTSLNGDRAGVKSYLAPTVVFNETVTYASQVSATRNVSDALRVGYIDTPPVHAIRPDMTGDYSWLLVDMSVEEVGDGLKTSKSWKLSRSRGWDAKIYTYPADA